MGKALVCIGKRPHYGTFVISVHALVFPPIIINIVVLDPEESLVCIRVDPGDAIGQVGIGSGVKVGLFPSGDENTVDPYVGSNIVIPSE